MALFEIHQRFKRHFLNELRVSFKEEVQIIRPVTAASNVAGFATRPIS